jgi:hypothetical protein
MAQTGTNDSFDNVMIGKKKQFNIKPGGTHRWLWKLFMTNPIMWGW